MFSNIQQQSCRQVDFLKEPSDVGRTVDVRVSPVVLPTLVNVLKRSEVPHQLLVEDIQRSVVLIDKSLLEMLNKYLNI